MQVSVENVQGLVRRLKVSVPIETVNKVVEKCFQKLAQTVKIDGFRPGKVPRRLLEERYGDSVRTHEAVPQIIQETLWDAFKQENIEPIGQPRLEGPVELLPNQPLNYAVLFDVLPEFEVKDLTGSEVEQIASSVTDADVNKAIEQLRQEHATWTDVARPIQATDRITFSYTVEVDGELIELEKAEKVSVQLGEKSPLLIPELEEKLQGLSAEDEKELKATFPEDYLAKSVAGKTGKFLVKIHTVQQKELPELNDEFIKKFDGATSLEEFKKNIQVSMTYYLKTALENINKLNVFDALVANNTIELPESMVQSEVEVMGKGFLQSVFKQQNIADSELQKHLPFLMKFYKKPAQKRVHLSLVVEAYLKKHPQTVSDEMIHQAAEERSSLYQDPKAWMDEYLGAPANKEQIRRVLLELLIANHLRETAKIKTVDLDYFAVLEKEKTLQNRDFSEMDVDDEGDDGHVHDENCQHGHHHHESHEHKHAGEVADNEK